ncbi:MAG: chromosome segregation protein ScpA [Desulfobacteraceae bacterium]|jgi:segregation and condensation protein A|nr:MAG: chromosome segregation protein ScpA [Desulfobacteraceae bacterium]
MENRPYEIKLENIFEGPMDLLVHLIKKNEVDIYDIPISLITEQFLAYLEWMQSLSMEVAGDFLVMAATLVQIKSRMLLPDPAADGSEDEDDPRMAIAGPLLEYLKMKSIAEQLGRRPVLNADVFARPADQNLFPADPGDALVRADIFELIQAYHRLMERSSGHNGIQITPERVSIKERMTEIIAVIEKKGTLAFRELLSERPEKIDIVVTFLAMLEMVRLNLIHVIQGDNIGELRLFYR